MQDPMSSHDPMSFGAYPGVVVPGLPGDLPHPGRRPLAGGHRPARGTQSGGDAAALGIIKTKIMSNKKLISPVQF